MQIVSIILDTNGVNGINIYVTNENFAKNFTTTYSYSKKYNAWYIKTI